VNNQQINS